jgi:anti-anti-sigma factor
MPKPLVITVEEPEWDIATCDRLAEVIAPALDHPSVIIDLSSVQYIDSTCLTKFAEMYADRVLVNGYPPCHLVINTYAVSRLFTIAKFDQIWPIHETLDEALTAVALPSQAVG